MKKELNDKQMAFCREYVVDYNGTQAAIRAGYSKKTANRIAYTLLTKIDIQREIARRESLIENKTTVTKEKIIRELSLLGFSDMQDHITIDDSGCVQAVGIDELPIGASRAIKKVKERRIIKSVQGTAKNPSEDVILESTLEYELHDKINPLINMGKELGMFRDRPEFTGDVTLRIVYDEKPHGKAEE
ncbi:MAG TPA: terminase small subunit [Candidatus Omnitrophota bacterium]|nr:terminase small subunit [Candidatus Omnitrophota bacterium]